MLCDFLPPPNDENPKKCVERRIVELGEIINQWKFDSIIPRANDSDLGDDDISDNLKRVLLYKCMYLRCAYQYAVDEKENGVTWGRCCEIAIEQMAIVGITIIKSIKTVETINIQFCTSEMMNVR